MRNKMSRWLALSAVRGVALLVLLTGLSLLIGGAKLFSLGGSAYFALSGLGMTAAGGLMLALRPHGGQLFGVVFIASVVWALWDVGLSFWPLVSRLVALSLLTLLVASVYPALCRAHGWAGLHPVANTTSFILSVALVLTCISAFSPKNIFRSANSVKVHPIPTGDLQLNWATPAGNQAAHRFARIDQITQNNLVSLKQAWRTRLSIADTPLFAASLNDTPPAAAPPSKNPEANNTARLPLQASLTPLQIGSALYLCGTDGAVHALNLDSGRSLWRRDQMDTPLMDTVFSCAGLSFKSASDVIETAPTSPKKSATDKSTPTTLMPKKETAKSVDSSKSRTTAAKSDKPDGNSIACEGMLYAYIKGAGIGAFDPHTGAPCRQFAKNGLMLFADERDDVDASMDASDTAIDSLHSLSTATAGVAPLIYTPLLIRSALVINAQEWTGATLAALAPDSGKRLWQWPESSDSLLPPLALASGLTYDAALDLIYFSATSLPHQTQGAARTAIIALDARTGRQRWEFTPIHEDTWNYAAVAQPIAVDIPQLDGALDKGLIVSTRQGEIFLLDRQTGQPLSAIKELDTSASAARATDQSSPLATTASAAPAAGDAQSVQDNSTQVGGLEPTNTQPHSTQMPALGESRLREQDMWGLGLLDQLWCRIEYRKMRHDGPFTASDTQEVLQYPHPIAGVTWSALNYDPDNQVLLVKDIRLSARVTRTIGDDPTSALVRRPFVSPLGLPCQAPPYGTLSSIDLVRKQLIWQMPLGALGDEQLLGTDLRLNIPIGSPARGASLLTQSGVIFTSGTRSRELRALALDDGRELHRLRLPAGSASGPMTFISPDTGIQYVLVSTFTRDGSLTLIAYALSTVQRGRSPQTLLNPQTSN